MIVEFIGSTGSGKSTLIAEVRQALAAKAAVTSAFEVVAAPIGLQGIKNSSLKNLVQEFVGLPFFIGTLYRHKALVTVALQLLRRQSNFSFFTINNLRSLVRKIGVYEIIRRSKQQKIILVDEGTVLLPHNLLVFSDVQYTTEEITTLGRLLPLPDVVIYVRAPVASLVQRTRARPDPPREIRGAGQERVEYFVTRAVQMFDELVTIKAIQERTLLVENPDFDGKARRSMVEQITKFILEKQC